MSEECGNCEYNRQCFIKKNVGIFECEKEIKEILKILKKCVFGACITKHNSRTLLNYITSLQQKVEQLENIKKEAREYINNNSHYYSTDTHEKGFVIDTENEERFCNDLLNILNKGSDKQI